jgi:hypothetical protein
MNMKSILFFLSFLFWGLIIVFTISCSPALHQARIQIIAEPGQIQFTEKDYQEMFANAMATGVELGYKPVFSSKEKGIISFTKEFGMDKDPKSFTIQLQKQNDKMAYINMNMQSSAPLSDLTLKEFQDAFVAKWQR